MHYMTRGYIELRAGTRNWVLAPRLTERLRKLGYERAIHPKAWHKWQKEYQAMLPRCPHCKQVMPA